MGRGVYASLLLLSAPCIAAERVGGSLALVSDYVFRGVSQTREQPALQGDLHYVAPLSLEQSWSAGVWASNAKPNATRDSTAEIDAYLGYTRRFDRYSTQLQVVRYEFPWLHSQFDYDYTEISASVGYGDRVFLTVAWSPDTKRVTWRGYYQDGEALAYEASLALPLQRAFIAKLGVGYYDLHDLFDSGYFYYNAGIGYDRGAWHFAFDYIDVDDQGESLFAGIAGPRFVGTVLWRY